MLLRPSPDLQTSGTDSQEILQGSRKFREAEYKSFGFKTLHKIAVDTRFLKAAAVKGFQTYGGSLSFRATPNYNVSLGANYDTGTRFKAYSVGLSSAWRW